MMIKLVRIGKDAELRSANGKPVLSLSVVYDIGFGANKKSQWLNLAMWGAQAEKVAEHFSKQHNFYTTIYLISLSSVDLAHQLTLSPSPLPQGEGEKSSLP